jgi:hypothetical protein
VRLEERTKMAQQPIAQWGKDHSRGLPQLFVGKEADPERLGNEYIDGTF